MITTNKSIEEVRRILDGIKELPLNLRAVSGYDSSVNEGQIAVLAGNDNMMYTVISKIVTTEVYMSGNNDIMENTTNIQVVIFAFEPI